MSKFALKIISVNYWAVEYFIKTLNQLTASTCTYIVQISWSNTLPTKRFWSGDHWLGAREACRREDVSVLLTTDTFDVNVNLPITNRILAFRFYRWWNMRSISNDKLFIDVGNFPQIFILGTNFQWLLGSVWIKYSWRKSVWLPTWLCKIEGRNEIG